MNTTRLVDTSERLCRASPSSATDPDAAWDDHASRAPEIVYRLLEQVLHRASPRAVTLEYNWSSRFPQVWLGEELERVRGICRGRAVR